MKFEDRSVSVMLTIAGSDNSGGAGIQADLKTATSFGVYGTSAITCVVAEHPGDVQGIHPIPPDMVALQIQSTAEAFKISSIKTGMLYSAEIIQAVVAELERLEDVPLVVDPVMVATSGSSLLKPEAIQVMKERLLPMATLVTPNKDEAELLLGNSISSLEDLKRAALVLSERYQVAFLVKGGHLSGDKAVDVLCQSGEITLYEVDKIPGLSPHGTGCTYSAAIASCIGQGKSVSDAVASSKKFITNAIVTHHRLGAYACLNLFSSSVEI